MDGVGIDIGYAGCVVCAICVGCLVGVVRDVMKWAGGEGRQ